MGAPVRIELQQADELGITAVPAFVFDRRWSVCRAQDTGYFVQRLRRLAGTLDE